MGPLHRRSSFEARCRVHRRARRELRIRMCEGAWARGRCLSPVTPPAVPSPPKSPPRELLEDQPPRPPCDDTTNELDFDDCGRDPGPCAIARALSQLQSSVAPRRMVMV